jgi:ribonucrease Y
LKEVLGRLFGDPKSIVFFSLPFLTFLVGLLLGYFHAKKSAQSVIRKAEDLAKKITEDAEKASENLKKELEIKSKDKLYSQKSELEKEIKDQKVELKRIENRLIRKEENLDRKVESLDKKEKNLTRMERELANKRQDVDNLEIALNEKKSQLLEELEKVSSMSREEAKQNLIQQIEEEARLDAAKSVRRIEEEAKQIAERKSKEIMGTAIQRFAAEHVVETTVSVVDLPNDEMKGRIIGREGRNIRSLELATGVDIIVDDTPEAVIISGFNAIRRKIAQMTLERLISDGRIHPARIESIVSKVEEEVHESIREEGEQAVFEVGIDNVHEEMIKLLGRLKYRTSYGQNTLQHSKEVAFLAGVMAAELGIPEKIVKRAGLLHDIGKAVDHEVEGAHAKIGADIAKKYNENDVIVHAILCHHDDDLPISKLETVLVQAADALSAARPGARREILETYIKRLEKLEAIADSFTGVGRAFAIQAGREIRIIVEHNEINDEGAQDLSREIARKIEKELEYPGQIKVTVIRETRAIEYAK